MPPEFGPVLVVLFIVLVISLVVFAIISEKKKDAARREKANMRGWRYEGARGNRQGFSVEGSSGSLSWRLEERRSGGKNDQRPLFFSARELKYGYGVFVFGDKREVGYLQSPVMQYILKLGAKMAPSGADAVRIEALMSLKDAQAVDVPDSAGTWKYAAFATHPDFAMKVLGAGLQAEYDSMSMLKLCHYAPSIMLTGEGMEMKWGARGVDAGKMEAIIESSQRIAGIIQQAVRG